MNDEGRRDEDQLEPNEHLLEGRDAALAAEVLTASLEPAELPAGGWERLRAATASSKGVEPQEGPQVGRAGRLPAEESGVTYAPPPRPWSAFGWAAAATVVLVVAGLGVWGVQQASESARLRDDQRILAYWMGNPDMRLTTLQPAGDATDPRLGVLCVLPDGRALILQPNPAGRGQTYVVVGRGSTGVRELARGDQNMIQFDVSGVDVVELRLEDGGEVSTLARATVN